MRRFWGSLVLVAFFLGGVVPAALAQDAIGDLASLDDLLFQQNSDSNSNKTLVLNPSAEPSSYHVAVGLSYTGVQMRYQFSRRWATEVSYQFGSTDSNYGNVRADVFGLRAYRFMPIFQRLDWYLGGEGAYAKTNTENANYQTTGFAAGAFSGVEYHIVPRVTISADVGPYVISLKEKLSGLSQTGVDFVVNTAVNVFLF